MNCAASRCLSRYPGSDRRRQWQFSLDSPTELSGIIAAEDTKSISKAQGVGAKTAGRVALELKDKMQKAFPTLSGASQTKRSAGKGSVPSAAFTSAVSDARDALLVLGYSQADVNEALTSFCDTSAGTDEIIKAALAYLTSN